ncbi:ATP-grasp domain-containing protein [Myroides sp. C15-4]|uniref:ATP-grasp domain-containing protein n=1 Tax=Myroides sp. C15-4 TaxID=3400532 RepID=UPI003D2F61E9
MKIAIHHREGSFSNKWIEYCEYNQIEFIIVDAFSNDIIDQIKGVDIFLWHHHQGIFEDTIWARTLLNCLELKGILVFPNFNTAWHFDNKIAQKLLFESLNLNSIKSYVFFDKAKAESWVKSTSFPKVFKLKGGASSSNVMLVKSKSQANRIIKKAFGTGFNQFNKWNYFKENISKFKESKDFNFCLKAFYRLIFKPDFSKKAGKEIGYSYFQDFIKDNDSDIRIIIIGDKAIGIKRLVRKNDFRASGSGKILYDKNQIPIVCVEMAFETVKCLNAQCLAFDFVFDNGKPLIVEISYGFLQSAYYKCPGYWTSDLEWKNEAVTPEFWIIENMINETNKK